MMVELIDDFFAEYPAPTGGLGKVDTTEADEVIGAIAKTVAELTRTYLKIPDCCRSAINEE